MQKTKTPSAITPITIGKTSSQLLLFFFLLEPVPGGLVDWEEFEELENGQQMTELTLLESQTDNNNRNQIIYSMHHNNHLL